MVRWFHPTPWLLAIALIGMAALGGCEGVSGAPQPTATTTGGDSCSVPAAPASFSEQFLIGGDSLESYTFFAYKLDQQTGVPTAMPWSPMRLDGFVVSETPDASGDYIYLGLGIGLTSDALETFRFPRDGSSPVRLNSQPLWADQLSFDPQQRYLYALRQGNIHNSRDLGLDSFLSVFQIDSNHVPHDTNQTLTLADRSPSFGFKDQGRAVVVSREHVSYGNTGIAVLRRDCSTGAISQASETPILRSLILTVPSVGNGIIGYRLCCGLYAASGSQLSRYDSSTQAAVPLPNGTMLDTYTAAIDHGSDFAVMVAAENPNQEASPHDLLKVYRYDATNVALTQTDQYQFPPLSDGGSPEIPFDVAFDLADKFVYVTIHDAIAVFRLDHITGKITPIAGSPFFVPTLLDPISVFGR